MSMTLRLPERLDIQTTRAAEELGVSKHRLVVDAVREKLDRIRVERRVDAGILFALGHDVELLRRLADA